MVRVKNRYLVVNFLYPSLSTTSKRGDSLPEFVQFHAPTPDTFHTGHLTKIIRQGVAELFGDYGMGKISGLRVNYWSPATSTAIIRCPREHYQMVWAALTFITKIPKSDLDVVLKVVRVSGTIRKAEEEVIRRAKVLVRRAKYAESGGSEGKMVERVVHDVEKRRELERGVLAQFDEAEDDEESGSGSGSES